MADNQISDELREITGRIVSGYQPKGIVLFGSWARGDARQNSDIDLFIIKDDQDKRPFRVAKVLSTIDYTKRVHPLDVIVYTPEELEKRKELGDFFVLNVLKEGKILYGQL